MHTEQLSTETFGEEFCQTVLAASSDKPQQARMCEVGMGRSTSLGATTSGVLMNIGIWNHLDADHPMKRWTVELALKLSQKNEAHALDSRGFIVECQDADLTRSLMQQVSKDSGWPLREVTGTDLARDVEDLIDAFAAQPSLVFLPHEIWPRRASGQGANNDLFPDERVQQTLEKLSVCFDRMAPKATSIFVAGVRRFDQLPEVLRSPGRFDRRLTFEKPEPEILGQAFIDCLGDTVLHPVVRNSLAEVGAMLFVEYALESRRLSLLILALERRARQEQRRMQFKDIYEMVAFGTGESTAKFNTPEMDRTIATHEAGHAVMEFLTNGLRTPPAYCTIVTRDHFAGLSMPNFQEQMLRAGRFNYADCLQRIQVGLAGRAAEHILLGVRQISVGLSEADLDAATQIARDMFQRWGLPSDGLSDDDLGSNLMRVDFQTSPMYTEYVDRKISYFLREQYKSTAQTLRDNQALLSKVVDALLEKKSLVAEDFMAIWGQE